jgi:hypothetical protein
MNTYKKVNTIDKQPSECSTYIVMIISFAQTEPHYIIPNVIHTQNKTTETISCSLSSCYSHDDYWVGGRNTPKTHRAKPNKYTVQQDAQITSTTYLQPPPQSTSDSTPRQLLFHQKPNLNPYCASTPQHTKKPLPLLSPNWSCPITVRYPYMDRSERKIGKIHSRLVLEPNILKKSAHSGKPIRNFNILKGLKMTARLPKRLPEC